MADKSINQLPVSDGLTDDGLLVVYQNYETKSIRGELIRQFAEQGIEDALANAKESGEFNGKDGYTPVKGKDYFDGDDGEDGISPTVSIESIDGGHKLTITDKDGKKSINVMDGTDGDDGVSPTVSVENIAGGYRLTITDATGTKSVDVLNGTGAGDMLSSVYDPTGKAQDIFAYLDNTAIPAEQKGAAGGVAELDDTGKVPAGQMPSLDDLGAVSKTGDIMTGQLSIRTSDPAVGCTDTDSNTQALFRQSSNQTVLSNRNVFGKSANQRSLVINNSAQSADIKYALRLYITEDGKSSWHNIYGTHNNPTPEDIGAGRVNPNLLHNWCFAKPVNQRGDTNVTGYGGYFIDRWTRAGYSNATITLEADGLRIDNSAVTSGATRICQILDNADALANKPITLSVLVTEVSGDGHLSLADSANTTTLASKTITSPGLYTLNYSGEKAGRVFFGAHAGGKIKGVAIKLELGTHQTLAHQDADGNWVLNEIPDYGEQLALCQRFAVVYPAINTGMYWTAVAQSGTLAYVCIPLPQRIRTIPTITADASNYVLRNGTTDYAITAFNHYTTTTNSVVLRITADGLMAGEAYVLRGTATSDLIISADL